MNPLNREPGQTLVSKTPFVLYFSSEDVKIMRKITFKLTAVGSSGEHETLYPGTVFTVNAKEGSIPLFSNTKKNLPDLFAVFQAPIKNLPGYDFTCSPVGTRCCESVYAYRMGCG